jgi:hypothetical protein
MKRVFSSESLADAGHVRALLEQRGIACFIKHEQLSGALGEVPFLECMPEVWVYDDAEAGRAEAVVRDLAGAADIGGEPWRCRQCGETNESQYASCWRCGADDAAD